VEFLLYNFPKTKAKLKLNISYSNEKSETEYVPWKLIEFRIRIQILMGYSPDLDRVQVLPNLCPSVFSDSGCLIQK